jgi:hypothetical protein
MTGPDHPGGEDGEEAASEPPPMETAAGEGAFQASPRLLARRADPVPLPPPLHDAEEIASLHLSWARLAGGGQGAPQEGGAGPGAGTAGGGGVGGVRAKVRARVVAAARADAAADRALIGDLVRAVDAVAARVDDIAARVGGLELLVQEVLDRLSEDLVRVQAALGTLDHDRARDEGRG